MIYNKVLTGKKCFINSASLLEKENEFDAYYRWMNDEIVTRFLYGRTISTSRESLKAYVEGIKESKDSYIFGIYEILDGTYIGNIKIGPIHEAFKFAEIGYMIGDQTFWGKGYGTEAVNLICHFGFDCLGLNRITSGCNEHNMGSNGVLKNNGFILEGTLRKHELLDGYGYTNKKIYGLLREEFVLVKEG